MKDETLLYYTIKIKRIREVSGKKNNRIFKDKAWCVDCKDIVGAGFAFCEPTLKKAIKQLKEELWV